MKPRCPTLYITALSCLAALLLGAALQAQQTDSWQRAVEQARAGGPILPEEDAAGAVNGQREATFALHTDQENSPWWQVDLGESMEIERVLVCAPHCSERLASFRILLSDEGHNWRQAYQHPNKIEGKGPFSVTLANQNGRFVRIQAAQNTWMHLAEVEVFPSGTPEQNVARGRPASQSSASRWSTRSVRLNQPVADWREDMDAARRALRRVIAQAGPEADSLSTRSEALLDARTPLDHPEWRQLYAQAAEARSIWQPVETQLGLVNPEALARALHYLAATFPETYPDVQDCQSRLEPFRHDLEAIRQGMRSGDAASWKRARALVTLSRDILLANPLLDMERILVIRRRADRLGLPANWQSNCVLRRTGYDNDIAVIDLRNPEADITSLYRPEDDGFVGDVELHPHGDRILFSASHPERPWQIYEARIDPRDGSLASAPRQITPDMGEDVNNYDACYLPNDDIIFSSTAPMVAVPCVNGASHVANLFRMAADGTGLRQLCFDQEHNWCPTVLNNGRVLYSRWEYADIPHSNSRILFHMNPDGTAQMEYYGSNSYWPNGVFYARPIPGHPTRVVGIVTGHHGAKRMGELVLFDPALGRREADGVVQRIPGYGQTVEPVVKDRLVDSSWPKFLHPYPLGKDDGTGSGRFFLVAMQPASGAAWGIYLVDVFDNMVLLKEAPGNALLEPVPLQTRPVPPIIPDKVNLARKDALVYLADIHRGPGLEGIPAGEIKALRLFTYTYGYRGLGGLYGTVGMDGPWDVRRIIGTVPVESDGSALFSVPANTPIAIQPLDREGKAVQLMRSWFTAMPGEVLSCVGCHETQNETPPATLTLASRKTPAVVRPWQGPARGFAFEQEVQPVLDNHCIGCHNGQTVANGKPVFSLKADPMPQRWRSKMSGHAGKWGGKFSTAYVNLHRYVRHPGIESDMHLLHPMDFHADTTELVQILRKGHHGVSLNSSEWSRIVTWIDLNTPYHGDWASIAGETACKQEERRAEMRLKYAAVDEFHVEKAQTPQVEAAPPLTAVPPTNPAPVPKLTGWPWSGDLASKRQTRSEQSVQLPGGKSLTFVYIPAGTFLMGSPEGPADEQPVAPVALESGFWISKTEVTNSSYAQFDPGHDSRREHKQGYQFGVKGYPLNTPDQPVVRISWNQARAFCRWLEQNTGLPVDLPTEAQWEYACRAGNDTPFWFGSLDADFAKTANMADLKTREFASNPYTLDQPIANPPPFDDWLPKNTTVNDGTLVSAQVGRYLPNPWGLHDMHGNVAEWTRSAYRPYPYTDNDGRNDPENSEPRVVRGGSWRDRPKRCSASYRLAYRPYQGVFNVGFRLVIDKDLHTLQQ